MTRQKYSKILYMVLSILAAVVLWIYVDLINQPTIKQDFTGIPVTFEGEDLLQKNGLMLKHSQKQTVDLTIEARRTDLSRLSRDNIQISVRVDSINSVGLKSLRYTITYPGTVQAGDLNVIDRSVYSIDVEVVRLLSKTVPFHGEFKGTLAEGYQAGAFQFDPASVTVEGEAQLVEAVDHALVVVRENSLSAAYTGALPFSLVDEGGHVLDSANYTCDLESVQTTLPVVVVKEIPLSVEVVSGGGASDENVTCTISPASISVSGPEDILQPLGEITIGTVELAKVVSSGSYTFDIPLPPGLTNTSGETTAEVSLVIHMDGLSTTTAEITDIELVNAPENVRADLLSTNLQVLLRGKTESLALLLPNNLRAEADLSHVTASAGKYTVPVTIYVDGFSDVGAVGEYRATISIR